MTILSLFIPLICAGISYLASNDLYIAIGIFIVGFLYFVLLVPLLNKKPKEKINRFKECSNFINTFIISLNTNDSLISAFEYSTLKISESFKKEIESINHLPIKEKLIYLERYFYFDLYSLFLKTLEIHDTQGKSIIECSSFLLSSLRNEDDYVFTSLSFGKKKILEVSILWMVSLLVLGLFRFGLSSFFNSISGNWIFKIGICVFFIFLYVSIEIIRRTYFKLEIKGRNI